MKAKGHKLIKKVSPEYIILAVSSTRLCIFSPCMEPTKSSKMVSVNRNYLQAETHFIFFIGIQNNFDLYEVIDPLN